jgi:hypothetical protein
MMKKWRIPALVVVIAVVSVAYAIYASQTGLNEQWVEIPGTSGIHYESNSVKRDGNMVYASLKNENIGRQQLRKIAGIRFEAAFYCTRGKIRTLKHEIRYEDGFIETSSEHHLEFNPNTDKINETHDLRDISEAPELEKAYHALCD